MNTKNGLFNELQARGFVYQSSDQNMAEILDTKKITLYVGTDPTADSLHIGHLIPMLMLSHFKRYGHNPILLVGGATGMIGDPSFKSNERVLLTNEMVQYNLSQIAIQVDKILNSNKENSIEVVNNYEWFKDFNILDFLRDVGKHFSINSMLARDSVRSRIENENEGMSFTEFSYALLQAYDFVYLNQTKGCNLQIWGSDQWWNIVAGIDLVKKRTWNSVYWLTCPLITKADGTKFGKTEGGNIWLDPKKTSPYKFYQFWLNVSDEDAEKFIKLYTFLPLNEIEKLIISARECPESRTLQRKLAEEITKMIHGSGSLESILRANKLLFWWDKGDLQIDDDVVVLLSGELEHIKIPLKGFSLNWVIESCIEKNIFSSKWEMKKLIDSNSFSLNGINIKDFDFASCEEKNLLLRKGKKNYYLLSLI